MKVLFLDVDGVINNSETNFSVLFPLERFAAFLVGRIVLETECAVVLSSSWRHHPDGVEEVSKRVVPLLGITPTLSSGVRGYEIQAWLDAHPEVERYAILDDDADMLPEQMQNFFQTHFMKGGLTEEIAERVIEHLGRVK